MIPISILSLSGGLAPLILLARAMLAYIFIVEGAGKIVGYSGVVDYMQADGLMVGLLPLVILTALGGVLSGDFRLKDPVACDHAFWLFAR